MGNVPMASTGMLRARSVPKQSSRGNKGFLRNVISYMLLCYSDRCTRALTRCSADEGTKLKGRERSPLATLPRVTFSYTPPERKRWSAQGRCYQSRRADLAKPNAKAT